MKTILERLGLHSNSVEFQQPKLNTESVSKIEDDKNFACSIDDEGNEDVGGDAELSSGGKRRRSGKLPDWATATLSQWLWDHSAQPYPTEEEKALLLTQTGLTLVQLNNWFSNARRRTLKKKVKKGQPEVLGEFVFLQEHIPSAKPQPTLAALNNQPFASIALPSATPQPTPALINQPPTTSVLSASSQQGPARTSHHTSVVQPAAMSIPSTAPALMSQYTSLVQPSAMSIPRAAPQPTPARTSQSPTTNVLSASSKQAPARNSNHTALVQPAAMPSPRAAPQQTPARTSNHTTHAQYSAMVIPRATRQARTNNYTTSAVVPISLATPLPSPVRTRQYTTKGQPAEMTVDAAHMLATLANSLNTPAVTAASALGSIPN